MWSGLKYNSYTQPGNRAALALRSSYFTEPLLGVQIEEQDASQNFWDLGESKCGERAHVYPKSLFFCPSIPFLKLRVASHPVA